MSELMDDAVIRMPYEMAMADDLSRRQFYYRANEILTKLERIKKKQERDYGRSTTGDITEKCEWKEDHVDEGSWDTACGLTFYFSEGTPTDHSFYFCCFCGKSLLETKLAAEDEEDEDEE